MLIRPERLAALVGPVLIAIAITENPYVNPHLYDSQIPPVVYLNGTLIFIAGLSIIRVHNLWRANWTILLTGVGWLAALVGLVRMTFPSEHVAKVSPNSLPVIVVELLIFALGVFLTYKGYRVNSDRE